MWWNLEKTNPEENKKTTTKLKIKQNKPKKKKKRNVREVLQGVYFLDMLGEPNLLKALKKTIIWLSVF